MLKRLWELARNTSVIQAAEPDRQKTKTRRCQIENRKAYKQRRKQSR